MSSNLVHIQVIQKPLLTIFSVKSSQKTSTILVSPSTFANSLTYKSNVFKRDWSKFDQENFILDYFDIDWSNLLNLNEKNVDLTTNNFLNAMNSLLNKYAPFKKISKYKIKFKTKPWITFDIQKSISVKSKLFIEEIHQ